MIPMVLGLLIFFGVHLLPTATDVRHGLNHRFGDTPYRIGFSILSLIGLVLIVVGFHKLQLHPEKAGPLWDPPGWTRHIAHLLMLPAMIALVAAYIPSRIRSALKHPMLVAIKLWALAHLIAAGSSVAALILFGSFLVFAVYDRISIKKRTDNARPPAPASLMGDFAAIAIGSALYAALLLGGHHWLIGLPVSNVSLF